MAGADAGLRQSLLPAATLLIALALTALPLPSIMNPFRPDWIALLIIYWCIFTPRRTGVIGIFLAGLLLDVLYGTLLGQHALALLIMSYPPLRFHLRIRVFSWVQLSATVFALLCTYQFALFWINGVAGQTTMLIDYWGPVLTGTAVWPIVMLLLDGLRLRFAPGD